MERWHRSTEDFENSFLLTPSGTHAFFHSSPETHQEPSPDRRLSEPALVPQPLLLKLASKLLDRRDGARDSFESSKYHSHDSIDEKDRN